MELSLLVQYQQASAFREARSTFLFTITDDKPTCKIPTLHLTVVILIPDELDGDTYGSVTAICI